MVWLVLALLLLNEDQADYHDWLHFLLSYHLIPRKKPAELWHSSLLPTTGFEPGPPAQQASAQSITPAPLGPNSKINFAEAFSRSGKQPILSFLFKFSVHSFLCVGADAAAEAASVT